MGSASIKFDFTLQSGKNGAYLIMHRLRTITTPTSVPMLELAKIKALQGMFIVTEVVACPSYAMGIVAKGTMYAATVKLKLSDLSSFGLPFTGETNISVALSASPAVSFVTSGTANLEWQTSAATGTFRQTQAADDEPVFSVLYQLKKMSKPWKSFFFGSSKRAALEPEPDEANMYVPDHPRPVLADDILSGNLAGLMLPKIHCPGRCSTRMGTKSVMRTATDGSHLPAALCPSSPGLLLKGVLAIVTLKGIWIA